MSGVKLHEYCTVHLVNEEYTQVFLHAKKRLSPLLFDIMDKGGQFVPSTYCHPNCTQFQGFKGGVGHLLRGQILQNVESSLVAQIQPLKIMMLQQLKMMDHVLMHVISKDGNLLHQFLVEVNTVMKSIGVLKMLTGILYLSLVAFLMWELWIPGHAQILKVVILLI